MIALEITGWIKIPLGREVGLDHGHIVLDGDPAPLSQTGAAPNFRLTSIVAIQSLISATAEHLLHTHRRVSHYFTMRHYVFLPKLPLSLSWSGLPSNTCYLWPTRVIIPNVISIGSAVFLWVPNAILYNALSLGKRQNCPFSFGLSFCHPAGEDRVTAIGNMHKNW